MKTAYRVIREYVSEFPNPLIQKKGDMLHVEEKETQWDGWLWCTLPDRKSGWVPESYLERVGDQGTMLQDYNATELTVQSGEILQVFSEAAGWYLCSKENGEKGWVPAENLEKINDSESKEILG